MSIIDMPLDELQQYYGKSPLPDDFDAYWEKTLDEMKHTDPAVEITPAALTSQNVEFYDMYFTGLGGARIYAKLLKPKKIESPCPAIVEFHGYTGDSGDWVTKLGYAANGFVVASLDCRGQGGKSEDRGSVRGNTHHGHIIRGLEDSAESLLFRYIFADTAQLAGLVMDMDCVDSTRVASIGNSQGGALSLACAALEPRIQSAVSVFPFLCDYKRVLELDLPTNAYSELKTFFRKYDPVHAMEEEYFNRLGYIDIQNLTPRIQANVCMFTGLVDDICPASTQFAAYNKIVSPKEMVIYPDYGHEGMPGREDRIFEFITKHLYQ